MVSFKKLCFWKPPPLGISINLPFLGAGNDIFWNRILNKSGPYFTNYLLITAMALAIIWLQWKWHNMWQSKTNSFILLILSYIFPAFSWDVHYKETVQGMLKTNEHVYAPDKKILGCQISNITWLIFSVDVIRTWSNFWKLQKFELQHLIWDNKHYKSKWSRHLSHVLCLIASRKGWKQPSDQVREYVFSDKRQLWNLCISSKFFVTWDVHL